MRARFDPPYPAGRGARWAPTVPDAGIRASDAERHAVADRLSRHYADGRLDEVTFRSRLDRAMGAVTRGDLHGLFDDLPPLADDPEPRPDRPRRGRRLATTGLAVLVVLAASAVVSTGVHLVVHGVWLALVVTGVVLLVRSRRRTC